MNPNAVKAPIHLWIIGILSLLWNAVGAFDYLATEMKLESYMSQFSQAQLDYFYAFPKWVVAAWAIAVWGSLLGSFALLLRKAWAVWLFGLGILGLAVTTVYNFVLANGLEIMGSGAAKFTAVIWVIALFLYFYALAMTKRGVLR
jgi:hypothetical protein